jgi:SAM-dependent methyltransferase
VRRIPDPIQWYRNAYLRRRDRAIAAMLADAALLDRMAGGEPLSRGHGAGLDERAVEIPWVVGMLARSPAGSLLDAGSALNHASVVAHAALAARDLTICTLAPESSCFWQRGISYQFGDLRSLPFRDAWFQHVACVSTLEHVGFDNSGFTGDACDSEHSAGAFLDVAAELARVLQPGGLLLLTVPFGQPQQFDAFRQFDAHRLAAARAAFAPVNAVEHFFRYDDDGWRLSDAAACEDAMYNDHAVPAAGGGRAAGRRGPGPVAAGAVACCAWTRAHPGQAQ